MSYKHIRKQNIARLFLTVLMWYVGMDQKGAGLGTVKMKNKIKQKK